MELEEVGRSGLSWPVHLHLLIQPIIQYQVVSQRQSMRFHGMIGPVVEIAHILVIEIGNFGLSAAKWLFGRGHNAFFSSIESKTATKPNFFDKHPCDILSRV